MAKTYQKKWLHAGAIIRRRGGAFQVEINADGKRRRKSWDTLAKAKTYAEQKKIEIRNRGIAAIQLTGRQTQEAVEAVKLLQGVSLLDAARFYVRHHKPLGGVKSLKELMTMYLDAKEQANRRPDTIADIRTRIGRLVAVMGERHVHTITSKELVDWLDQGEYRGVTRANYIRAFRSFFKFAIQQGLLEISPADALERPKFDEKLPEIFSVGEVNRLLLATQSTYDRLVPYVALGLFAGLRTAEIEKLDWSAIDFESKLITVRPEVAKRRRQRHVTMSNNLLAWLLPRRKTSGRIAPAGCVVNRWRRKILQKAAIAKWPHNGMRHSFGSYHLAKFNNPGKTAMELGHTQTSIVFDHYRALVKPDEAEAYWEIYPRQEGTIIQLPVPTAS